MLRWQRADMLHLVPELCHQHFSHVTEPLRMVSTHVKNMTMTMYLDQASKSKMNGIQERHGNTIIIRQHPQIKSSKGLYTVVVTWSCKTCEKYLVACLRLILL